MPVAELERFKRKYPQYDDLDDSAIANKLATKYPDAYGDLPSKVEQSKGTFRTEVLGPIAHGASSLAFDIPRVAMERQVRAGTPGAEQAQEFLFPEQRTVAGKSLRFGSEVAGIALGGAGKVAGKVFTGVGKKVGKSLLGRVGQSAASGAAYEAVTAKPSIEEYNKGLATGAVAGGALPILGRGGRILGKGAGEVGKFVSKNFGGVTEATRNTINRLGANRVFDAAKGKTDYIVQDLAPKVYSAFRSKISNFDDSMKELFSKKLKVPSSVIGTIDNKGVNNIEKVRQFYGDSTDEIYQSITKGFEAKRETANTAYRLAMKQTAKNFGGTIDARDTVKTMESVFKGSLGEATRGPQGNRLFQIMQELKSRRPAPKGFYAPGERVPTSTQLVRQIRGGEKLTDISGEVRLNKKQFMEIRDALNNLYKENPYDRNIMKVMNQLYSDGEKAGLKGLGRARSLQRQAFDAEENLFKKGLIGERKLDKYHALTKEEKRQLRNIEDYTGVKFVDDLESITAARYLDKLGSITPEEIAKDLIKAKNPEWTKTIEKKYIDLLGEKDGSKFMDDLYAHFANRDFNLASDVPGTGGGVFPGRSGALRLGISGATKQYYKNIKPRFLEGSRILGEARSRIPSQTPIVTSAELLKRANRQEN